MKLSRESVVSGLFLMCIAEIQCTLGPGLSTPNDRERVVSLTRSLERDPLAETAPATRQWLQKWITDVPDIRVHACDDLLGQDLRDHYAYSNEIKLQPMFSAAAFAIERRDKA